MNMHKPIIDLVEFYANELKNEAVLNIIRSQKIENEVQASGVLEFCEEMFDLAIKYESENRQVLGGPAKVYDVEKVYSVLNDLVSEQGFDYLIED